MKQTNESAPIRFRLTPTIDGGTRLVRVDSRPAAIGGAFPLRAIVKERRPAEALLRDVAEAMAAAAIFS